jgi:hypothetical protein
MPFVQRILKMSKYEVTREWRKLHNGELNNLYSSHIIVRAIKWRNIRWAGYVARMGGEECTGCWWGNLRERDHLGDPGVDGRIKLRLIFRKWVLRYGLD